MVDGYLMHHGIKGQKWGVRRYQNEDGSLTPEGYEHYGLKNLKRARTSNLSKWGKSADSNILYIAGYSGSGKSTTSIGLSKRGDTVIHLDGYTDGNGSNAKEVQNKKFNSYLDKKVPKWKRMRDATSDGSNGTMKRYTKEYWKTVDQFRDAVESFGREEFKNNRRVIVEGVQLADDWWSEDKSWFNGKPIVIMNTNPITSMKRAFARDERGGLLKGLGSLDSAKEYIDWYSDTSKTLNQLAKETDSKYGQEEVKELLKQYGKEKL